MAIADNLQKLQDSLQDFDINDIDFENIGSWPLPVKVASWVVAFVACVFGGYKFDIEQMQINLNEVVKKEQKLKDDYRTKAFQAANLDAYRKQMEDMELSFGALIGQLPSDTEVPGLLEDITNKGVGNGLEFESIDLKNEHMAEFYAELPIEIVVSGSYHDIGAFVSGVAGLPRIVTLHDFSIKPTKEKALSMTITAKTYRYADQSRRSKPEEKRRRKK